jgi:predicted nucleic acid-binding protein
MIVVADTGPLHYLILLDHVELLHRFYGQVVVPDAVAIELSSPSAPSPVRDWMARAPPWLSVVPVESDKVQAITTTWISENARLSHSPQRCMPTCC